VRGDRHGAQQKREMPVVPLGSDKANFSSA